eukprot:3539363-Amphidinium_carterae.1
MQQRCRQSDNRHPIKLRSMQSGMSISWTNCLADGESILSRFTLEGCGVAGTFDNLGQGF